MPLSTARKRMGLGTTRSRLSSAWSTYRGSFFHRGGMELVKFDLGLAGKGLTRALGPLMLGYSTYSGYKTGGTWGGVKAAGEHLLFSYALGGLLPAVGATADIALGLGGMAAGLHLMTGGSVTDVVRPWAKQRMFRHGKLEMGAPILDDFGTVSTMRQRSLMAIQNSRINGRTGLGNEGALSYNPYFR